MDLTLSEIRRKYPQYNDMDDDSLAKAYHGKYAASTPFADFTKAFMKAINPISTAEAAESATDYSRGGTQSRLQAIREAASDDYDGRSVSIPQAQKMTDSGPVMSTSEANQRLDRLIAEQEARKAAENKPKWTPQFKKMKIPVKETTRVIRNIMGEVVAEEAGYVDNKGNWYTDDPNAE